MADIQAPPKAPMLNAGGFPELIWNGFFLALRTVANRLMSLLQGGTAGQVLTSNGAGVDPSYQAIPAVAAGSIRCSAYNNVLQVIGTGAFVALAFDSDDINVGGSHSTTVNTTRFTAPATGTYLFQGFATFAASAVGERDVFSRLNGTTTLIGSVSIEPVPSAVQVTALTTPLMLVALTAGDYLEVIAFQSTGGNLNSGMAGPGISSNRAMFMRIA